MKKEKVMKMTKEEALNMVYETALQVRNDSDQPNNKLDEALDVVEDLLSAGGSL
jgi:hypothetical protein